MLVELGIANFAIIDQLRLTLAPGFNVLTGETGAGKSIVIDAVSSLLGARIGSEYVRSGTNQARVEGIFALEEGSHQLAALRALLQEYGAYDEDQGGALIVVREINSSGRSVARLNGRAVPLAVLQQVGSMLIDIHGQTEHLSLLKTSRHIDFLDEYGGLRAARSSVAARVGELRQVRHELERLLRDERQLARQADLLRFQVEEIEAAGLQPGEEEELTAERNVLANAERLSEGAEAIYMLLHEGIEDQRSATDLLAEAAARAAEMARMDPSLEDQRRRAEELSYELEEVARAIRSYRDGVEHNPPRLEAVEERLELIRNLKRKYGSSIHEVLEFGRQAAIELGSLSGREEWVEELRQREAALLIEVGQLAHSLSQQRQEAAHRLSQAVEQELAELNMAKARFAVSVSQSEKADGVSLPDGRVCAFDAAGVDEVEFLIAPNPGEPMKPLTRIASGGETSRLMLALKSILSEVDAVPTLIFDEIDAGIGGRSGHIVARKLWSLTPNHQVICVTHLPQIACFADRHFSVAKATDGERTYTRLAEMEEAQRVEELSSMLGGLAESSRARENARELLAQAGKWKRQALASAPAVSE